MPGWVTNREHRRRRERERGAERESEIFLIRKPEKATVFRLSEVFVTEQVFVSEDHLHVSSGNTTDHRN